MCVSKTCGYIMQIYIIFTFSILKIKLFDRHKNIQVISNQTDLHICKDGCMT